MAAALSRATGKTVTGTDMPRAIFDSVGLSQDAFVKEFWLNMRWEMALPQPWSSIDESPTSYFDKFAQPGGAYDIELAKRAVPETLSFEAWAKSSPRVKAQFGV